jgi:glycogen debranching enzyme
MAMARCFRPLALICLGLAPCTIPALAADDTTDRLAIQSEAVGPQHFLAVHGQRALIQGYTGAGLEVWTYPLQLLDGYQVTFREQGATSAVDAATLLRSVRYAPDTVIRTYVGPDYVVRETLFVPLNRPAAIIGYSVDSPKPIDIAVGLHPVLDLMWPGAIGGQATRWDTTASAYVLFEPLQRFAAFVASPDMDTHDKPVNGALQAQQGRVAFSMQPSGKSTHRTATVVMGLLDPATMAPAVAIKRLLAERPAMEREAKAHYAALEGDQLQIVTPDASVNSALAWANVALDQSWVCSPTLGCGVTAGYGPSRNARRPQYEWFFAGDGMIAADAMVATGQYSRAKDEYIFIMKHQDPATGMIWHELSQSASFMDWKAYPYMYVHVDTSFQFLAAVERYVAATGDTAFVAEHWASLEAAYRYCQSLIDAKDGLPRIPADKEGPNEQDRLTDELSLSAGWMKASAAFARMARLSGHADEAILADRSSTTARASIARRYGSGNGHGWIDGYTASGKPVNGRGSDAMNLVENRVLTTGQSDGILDQIATADYQSDWGTRGMPASAPGADPSSYAHGSVSALRTAEVAAAYWRAHRPYTAFPIWQSLMPWNLLDSPGHIHEVAAGDFYHQQVESVPEQTWSSAGLLSSTVGGLLGLDVQAMERRLVFAPNLPAAWDTLAVNHIHLPGSNADISLQRVDDGLAFTVHNDGQPFTLRFSPTLPLGAKLTSMTVDGHTIQATQEDHAQDSHAVAEFAVGLGTLHGRVSYQGGVEIGVPPVVLAPGDRSSGIKITGVAYKNAILAISADAAISRESIIDLRTDETVLDVKGAQVRPAGTHRYQLIVPAQPADNATDYRHVEITVSTGPTPRK